MFLQMSILYLQTNESLFINKNIMWIRFVWNVKSILKKEKNVYSIIKYLLNRKNLRVYLQIMISNDKIWMECNN